MPFRRFFWLALLVLVGLGHATGEEADESRLRRSWIAIDPTISERGLISGQQFTVAVEYELKAAPAVTLELMGLGPWIDNPDGTYTKKRTHIGLPGLYAAVEVQPGRRTHTFSFTAPEVTGHSSVLWLARFKETGGKAWPWSKRVGGGRLGSDIQPFTIASAQPGNLFTYGEPVTVDLIAGAKAVAGQDLTAAWSVLDADGLPVVNGVAPFRSLGPGQRIALPLPLTRRGVFGLRVEIAGWGVAETTLARIPDVLASTAGEPTRFGMHATVQPGARDDLAMGMDVARRLGLTWCRTFVSWSVLQPASDEWRLEPWDRALALAKEKGIAPALCLVDPPAWVMRGAMSVGYAAFDFDRDAWQRSITTLGARWRGQVASYEWLNEIVPGDSARPVDNYMDFCRIGTTAVKTADPAVVTQLAGGLWPRNFRRALLSAGIAAHIDVLPIHYGNGAGINDARGDLAAVGAGHVAVWDNETGRGLSTWGMPQAEALRPTLQRDWVMERWTSELAAGAERLVFFGGAGDPAGNWDYSYEDHTPRPVAATLAVLVDKLHGAEFQGRFSVNGNGPFHLFLRAGKPVLVVPKEGSMATVDLCVGSAGVVRTDDQGEESAIAANAGVAAVPLGPRPAFVEGGELDVLRAYVLPTLRTPDLAVLAGRSEAVVVDLRNRSDHGVEGTLTLAAPDGLAAPAPVPFRLAAGSTARYAWNSPFPTMPPPACITCS